MMTVVYVIIAILIFGLLIIIHEGGHFLFARLFGVTVKEFAIGMGPAILSRTSKKSGIKYAWRLIPFGGYVSMVGEDEESDDPNAFNKKPVWQRIIITAAGAGMNLLAGVLVMSILVATSDSLASSVVHRFMTLLPEDEIIAVESIPVASEAEIAYQLLSGREDGVDLTVERDGNSIFLQDFTVRADETPFAQQSDLLAGDNITAVGETAVASVGEMIAALLPENMAVDLTVWRVGHKEPFVLLDLTAAYLTGGSYTGGLREDDRILSVDGTPVHTANELVYEVMRKGIEPIEVTVRRDGEEITLSNVSFSTMTESGEVFGSIDFYVYRDARTPLNVLKHSFFRSVSTIKMIPESLFDLLTGRYGISAVSGPVGVTQAMTEAAQQSIADLIYLAVVISMNLGVMNLLPFPALDGGRLVFLVVEGIRRKPVSPRIEGYVHFAGFAVLMVLMVLILAKDIIGLFL